MAFEWITFNLENAPLEIIDGDRGTNYPKNNEFAEQGYCLFLNAGNVTNSGFRFETCAFISKEKDSILRKGKLQRGDSVLTTRGTVGNVAFFSDDVPYENIRINSGMVIIRPETSKLDPKYLSLFLRSNLFQDQVKSFTTGSAQPQFPIRDIKRAEIPLPGIGEQKAIAAVLGALDDKIELNRRMNDTLEATAKALFKSWFVDFDPVRAKAEGRQPDGLAPEIAALFPDGFEESELGEIPKGWEITTFGAVSQCFDSKRIPLSKMQRALKRGIIPYYGATSVMDYVDEAIFDGVYLLLGEDGSVLKENGLPFTQYIWGKSWVNNHAHVLQGKDTVSTEQLMLFIQEQNISGYVTGAVQLKLNQGNMNRIPFILASNEINRKFHQTISPLYAKYRVNAEELEALSLIRDSLLPKLMSGELRVRDAEKLVEELV